MLLAGTMAVFAGHREIGPVLFAGIISTFIAAYLWIRVNPPLAPLIPGLLTVAPGMK